MTPAVLAELDAHRRTFRGRRDEVFRFFKVLPDERMAIPQYRTSVNARSTLPATNNDWTSSWSDIQLAACRRNYHQYLAEIREAREFPFGMVQWVGWDAPRPGTRIRHLRVGDRVHGMLDDVFTITAIGCGKDWWGRGVELTIVEDRHPDHPRTVVIDVRRFVAVVGQTEIRP